jgi:hypothetical protein
MLDDPGPETPVMWVDLSLADERVECRPWRPDGQEIACEVAVWVGRELKLDLVRRFSHEREDLVERWYFRGSVSERGGARELVGALTIQPDPPIRPPLSFRVRSPLVALDDDDQVALSEAWTRAAEARAKAELVAPGQGEEPTPSPYGAVAPSEDGQER